MQKSRQTIAISFFFSLFSNFSISYFVLSIFVLNFDPLPSKKIDTPSDACMQPLSFTVGSTCPPSWSFRWPFLSICTTAPGSVTFPAAGDASVTLCVRFISGMFLREFVPLLFFFFFVYKFHFGGVEAYRNNFDFAKAKVKSFKNNNPNWCCCH